VGYQSVAAFRRVFTDKMGMTPGQWRRLPDNDE
jgi:AraC family transcriptional activator of mtrCDE